MGPTSARIGIEVPELRLDDRALNAPPATTSGQSSPRATATSNQAVSQQAARVLEKFSDEYPKCFPDDLEASLGHLRLRYATGFTARTTNLLERSFVEERRRTKVIPRLLEEKGALKLVLATLIRCSQRWRRIASAIWRCSNCVCCAKCSTSITFAGSGQGRRRSPGGIKSTGPSILVNHGSSPWGHLKNLDASESTQKLLSAQNQPFRQPNFYSAM